MFVIKLQANPLPKRTLQPNPRLKITQTKTQKSSSNMQTSTSAQYQPQRLRDKKVSDVIGENKKRLVEVPYTASLADTMNALMANRVLAVPVAAPPGHWIGAGGSMILESDKQTGSVRKHYIGMATVVDILAYIAENRDDDGGSGGGGDMVADLDKKMSVPVSSVIGHCLESLSLWTVNPNMSILDCMEVFGKGIHRALVPIGGHTENVAGVELAESASSYRMLTQMDLLKFFKALDKDTYKQDLKEIMSRSVIEVGGVVDTIFGVSECAKLADAIRCMRIASLAAVPIIESSNDVREDHSQLINARDRKLKGTFSATDLIGCPISQLQSCLRLGVMEFTEKMSATSLHEALGLRNAFREPVTCQTECALGEVVDKAVANHVHRVWVVDQQGLLLGVVSLTDMIRAIRSWLISGPI